MRKYARLTMATAIGAGLVAMSAQPASAAARYTTFTCTSPKGDVGTLRVYHTKDRFKVTGMTYKIKIKGHKRHKSNIYVHDFYAGQTSVETKSGDNAKGDNKWHTLRKRDYGRDSRAKLYVKFTFDRPGSDPHCDDFGALKR